MGKILETTYHNTVEKVTGFNNTLIDNSFYTLSDKKPTIVTYYNIDKEHSALDPGAKIAYNNIGPDSPLRFHRITDFIIYGFTRIDLETDKDEFGVEAQKISGECFVLPNTIKPIEGDYFEVDHIKDSTYLFIITDVQQDTMLNGSNVYKLTYRLEYVNNEQLLDLVTEDFKMIEKREGTNIARVVKTKNYDRARKMDEVAVMLKTVFNNLYYNPYVQTFVYMHLSEYRVYDPYMIEFLIRNKILDNGHDSFVHVTHQIDTVKTFNMDYERTFLRVFETGNKEDLLASEYTTQIEEIKSYGTTFSSRFEPYFTSKYIKPPVGYYTQCIKDEILYKIVYNELVKSVEDLNEKDPLWINILIKHFSGEEFTEEEIESVKEIKYDSSLEAFYMIPLLILCLEKAIEKALN